MWYSEIYKMIEGPDDKTLKASVFYKIKSKKHQRYLRKALQIMFEEYNQLKPDMGIKGNSILNVNISCKTSNFAFTSYFVFDIHPLNLN